METELLLGLSAAFFTTFAFAPQAIKTLKTKNTDGISTVMYVMFTLGVLLWAVYGFIKSDIAILLANITVFLLALPVLVVALRNRS